MSVLCCEIIQSSNLKHICELNLIYLETSGDLASYLKLYMLPEAEDMKVEHVIWLFRVANNDLPELERKSEVDSLEATAFA